MKVEIIVSGAEKALDQAVRAVQKADDSAVRDAAKYGQKAVKTNLSYIGSPAPVGKLGKRSGRLLSQVRVLYFRRKNQTLGASIQVVGDRRFVMHINEHGAKSHGRVAGYSGASPSARRSFAANQGRSALPARQVFALTWQAVKKHMESIYETSFNRNFVRNITGV